MFRKCWYACPYLRTTQYSKKVVLNIFIHATILAHDLGKKGGHGWAGVCVCVCVRMNGVPFFCENPLLLKSEGLETIRPDGVPFLWLEDKTQAKLGTCTHYICASYMSIS